MKLISLMESTSFQLTDDILPFIKNIVGYKNIIMRIDFVSFGTGKLLPSQIIQKLNLQYCYIDEVYDEIKLYFFGCDCTYDIINRSIIKN